MKKGNPVDVPSQRGVPHQNRYPVEGAANMNLETTAIPIDEINSNAKFPMPDVSNAGTSGVAYGNGRPAFLYDSHTNGKK